MRTARIALPVLAVACLVAPVLAAESGTNMPGQIEHVVAYLGTAFIAWRPTMVRSVAVPLLTLAAVLEAGQLIVPGRTAQLVDFGARSLGVLIGIALAVLLRPHAPSSRRRRAF